MNMEIEIMKNYVNGVFRKSVSNETMEQKNPATGDIVSVVQKSVIEDIHEAVKAAKRAFEEEDWALNPRKRTSALLAWAKRMREEHENLAVKLTLETGKPLREARGEINGAIGYLEYYAAAARTIYGDTTSVDKYSFSILIREPVGVCGIIVPWNYPVTLLMRDLAPALAAGNTAVVKPANQASGISMAVFQLLDGISEFPKGVVNAVTGKGNVIGMELVRAEDVDMINFTGSSDTGKIIMREASYTMKKLSLELGGKSASIVFSDADYEKAMNFSIKSIFTHAGQLCTSASRLVVEESIKDKVLKDLKNRAEHLRVGNGLEEINDMGAITIKSQFDSIMDYIELGREEGTIVTGGNRITTGNLDKGFFIEPTIITDLSMSSKVVQEEIFGPVLVVQTFSTEDEAIEIANGTKFGLASAVWSKDINKAMRVARKLKAGTAWVNTYNRLFPETETGGYKESGIGRSGGIEGFLKFTELKHLCIDYSPV